MLALEAKTLAPAYKLPKSNNSEIEKSDTDTSNSELVGDPSPTKPTAGRSLSVETPLTELRPVLKDNDGSSVSETPRSASSDHEVLSEINNVDDIVKSASSSEVSPSSTVNSSRTSNGPSHQTNSDQTSSILSDSKDDGKQDPLSSKASNLEPKSPKAIEDVKSTEILKSSSNHETLSEINDVDDIVESASPSEASPSSPSEASPSSTVNMHLTSNGSSHQANLNQAASILSDIKNDAKQDPNPLSPKASDLESISHKQLEEVKSPTISKPLPSHEVTNILSGVSTHQVVQSTHVTSVLSARKLTSPFSWLSRNLGKDPNPTTQSSNASERRNTASSIATNGSSSEVVLKSTEQPFESDDTRGAKRAARSSLKDRFKLLRMQEEATNLPPEIENKSPDTDLVDLKKTQDINQNSSISVNEKSVASAPSLPDLSPKTMSSSIMSESGIVDSPRLVDWDLWQSVVDEGPAAVARTSSEELNRAITTGIPNVIRGVVWQILAQSKSEELERVYRDLVARGTQKDPDRRNELNGSTSSTSGTNSSNGREEVITSSASSISSENSTAAHSIVNVSKPPPLSKESESFAKSKANSSAERKKRALDDAAALQKLEKTIKRDLGARTSFSKFATSAALQESLFGVCKAYALFDEGVGYAQGMNFIVMPLLFNMPEDEAFCLLVKMMNQYHLRDLFIQDMPGLHMRLYQFERLLEDFEPALYCHLQRRQVTPHLYATQWFLTLFAYRFPLQLVLRIYDLILSEGLEAIIKFGMALMQKNAAILLGMSEMTALTKYLKDRLFDVYIDVAPSSGSILESGFFGSSGSSIDREVYRADQLIRDACAIKITPELLKTYTVEWEEKNRIEKEREQELENLRLSNKKFSHKVRRLEGRVQDHDLEHAALATELVRTKVQNQELQDENESLKIQVLEFRDLVEKLPQEVELRLQSEMDRLLVRNQEVHDENTRLEEEMSAMEKRLVETKMQYAEINAAHETLTRKWIDLRKALGD